MKCNITPEIIAIENKNPDTVSGARIKEAREIELLKTHGSVCPMAALEGKSFTQEKLVRAIKKAIEDPEILRALLCINSEELNITTLRLIGEPSVEGYAMLSDEDLFVVKAPRRENISLIHEYFVGFFGTNTLRNVIPNFAYILGAFECSLPSITEEEKMKKSKESFNLVCENSKKVYYVIYENIYDSVSFRDFARNCSSSSYMNIILQISLAISLAYHTFKFTHYDLHSENVLIRELENPITILYPFKKSRVMIKTKYIATIIDYGRSHIMYNGENFGFNFSGALKNRPFPMRDIYRVLTNSAYGNEALYPLVILLLSFFSKGLDENNIANYLSVVDKNYSLLPERCGKGETNNIDPDEFISHALEVARQLKESETWLGDFTDETFYGCVRGICPNLREAIETIATI